MAEGITNIKILVTGASGQLGRTLQLSSNIDDELQFIFLDKQQLDITNVVSIERAVQNHQPDFILNTAAYTQVDQAENEKERAFLINQKGVENIVEICNKHSIGLLHISTDYVFDGEQQRPYRPTDKINPKTTYGASKLGGERSILNGNLDRYWIIRTSWLYSPFGYNFVKTMLRLAKDKEALTIVNDQVGSPTNAIDLAVALIRIIPKLSVVNCGIYHFGNKGATTWFDFAKAIFEIKNCDITLSPVSSSQYPTLAQRPLYSVLSTQKMEEEFEVDIRHWKTALNDMLLTNYLN